MTRHHWLSLTWFAVMIVGPTVGHFAGIGVPAAVAWPVATVSPLLAGVRRLVR